MKTRTRERAQFLSDLLIGAIEHSGYGFAQVVEYEPEPDGDPAGTFAVIVDRYLDEGDEGYGVTHRVDLDTMARGLGVIRRAITVTDGTPNAWQPQGSGDVVLANADTFERLYVPSELRRELLECDRSNGDEGDYDVIGALAVLECALFGRVVYA